MKTVILNKIEMYKQALSTNKSYLNSEIEEERAKYSVPNQKLLEAKIKELEWCLTMCEAETIITICDTVVETEDMLGDFLGIKANN